MGGRYSTLILHGFTILLVRGSARYAPVIRTGSIEHPTRADIILGVFSEYVCIRYRSSENVTSLSPAMIATLFESFIIYMCICWFYFASAKV